MSGSSDDWGSEDDEDFFSDNVKFASASHVSKSAPSTKHDIDSPFCFLKALFGTLTDAPQLVRGIFRDNNGDKEYGFKSLREFWTLVSENNEVILQKLKLEEDEEVAQAFIVRLELLRKEKWDRFLCTVEPHFNPIVLGAIFCPPAALCTTQFDVVDELVTTAKSEHGLDLLDEIAKLEPSTDGTSQLFCRLVNRFGKSINEAQSTNHKVEFAERFFSNKMWPLLEKKIIQTDSAALWYCTAFTTILYSEKNCAALAGDQRLVLAINNLAHMAESVATVHKLADTLYNSLFNDVNRKMLCKGTFVGEIMIDLSNVLLYVLEQHDKERGFDYRWKEPETEEEKKKIASQRQPIPEGFSEAAGSWIDTADHLTNSINHGDSHAVDTLKYSPAFKSAVLKLKDLAYSWRAHSVIAHCGFN